MYVGVSPLFSSGTTSSTTNTDRNSSSLLWNNPLPLPSPVQKENGQMLFTLRVLAVIYIYPVLYTSSSCSPLCHQGKCFFFTSAVQMRRMGMTGTAPGSGGARKLNVAPSGAHGKCKAPTGHPVGLCASSVAEMGSIHPSPCLLWNLVQTFTSMVHSDHAGFWKGDGLRLQAASQARGCKPCCVCWHLLCHAVYQETHPCCWKCLPKEQCTCFVGASFYFIYSSVMSNIPLISPVFYWC